MNTPNENMLACKGDNCQYRLMCQRYYKKTDQYQLTNCNKANQSFPLFLHISQTKEAPCEPSKESYPIH